MWTAVQDFSRLVADGRWKVEFFSGEADACSISAYPSVALSTLVKESRSTVHPQETPDSMFNYLGMEYVESNTGDLVGFEPTPGRDIRSRSKVFTSNNVLCGRLRPYLNKVYLAAGEISEGICSGEFFVLVPDTRRIRPLVLRHILASSFVVDHLARFQSGAALPRVPLTDLLGIKVPHPPMEAQIQLEDALSRIDGHRRRLRQELSRIPVELTDALRQSLRYGKPLTMSLQSPTA